MGYIPKGAKWYLAEIIMEIAIENESRNVVHVNTTLVRADSPTEAYDRAQDLGTQGESSYENSHGKTVTHRFRGLRSLEVIHEELEHGAELAFSERIAVPEDEIAKLVIAKEQLGAFKPITTSQAPDYGSRDVREAAIRLLDQPANGPK
jgi:Domain of unknown function (DUF4288)